LPPRRVAHSIRFIDGMPNRTIFRLLAGYPSVLGLRLMREELKFASRCAVRIANLEIGSYGLMPRSEFVASESQALRRSIHSDV
jgi:hypothetical protein